MISRFHDQTLCLKLPNYLIEEPMLHEDHICALSSDANILFKFLEDTSRTLNLDLSRADVLDVLLRHPGSPGSDLLSGHPLRSLHRRAIISAFLP